MFHVSHFTFHEREGQSMIIAVLAVGGVILGATTIAGLLMVFQIRQTTNSADSAKAIFAADAGLESALYQKFANVSATALVFTNGASINVTCYNDAGSPVPECANTGSTSTKSVGIAATARRAFFSFFAGATSTLP